MFKFSSSGFDKIGSFFLSIFYPQRCIGCSKYGQVLCFDCAAKIETVKTTICPLCGKISLNGQYCSKCAKKENIFATGIIVAAHYESGPLKQVIYDFKYSGVIDLADILSELIFDQVKNRFNLKNVVIVPVPLTAKRKNTRGYNQSQLLARNLSKKLGISGGDALKRTRETKSQVGLSRDERLLNLQNAFTCQDAELVDKKIVFLIDDVTTTGATINECAKALKDAGAKKIWGVVVARNI